MVCHHHAQFSSRAKKLSAFGDVSCPISGVIHHSASRAEMLILK
ncbi:Hypothetical protein SmN45_4961 [Serratia marcescens]|nr:Hypothetical protein SmN45_4961 [Serratia marcescens]